MIYLTGVCDNTNKINSNETKGTLGKASICWILLLHITCCHVSSSRTLLLMVNSAWSGYLDKTSNYFSFVWSLPVSDMLYLVLHLNDWLLEATPYLMLLLFLGCYTTLCNNPGTKVTSVINHYERRKSVAPYFCRYILTVLKINNHNFSVCNVSYLIY
jgi:hypothetical protein